ncbi:MFS transporter [Streptomyces sp. NPDC048504]|uniref:MFS transporter n=1 Tax=Streptomyces sp. NPDC048504 TaxID=3365559 RepID=UPI00371B4057
MAQRPAPGGLSRQGVAPPHQNKLSRESSSRTAPGTRPGGAPPCRFRTAPISRTRTSPCPRSRTSPTSSGSARPAASGGSRWRPHSGRACGAGLVALVGAAGAMAADALSFALSAGSLRAVRTRERRRPSAGADRRPRLWAQIREGLAHVTRDPILRNSVAFNGTANFFVIMVETLGPVFLIRTLHLRPAMVGLLLALGAVGGVAGGVAARYLARKVGSARFSWISMTVLSLPGLLIPLAGHGWWVLLFGFGWISWTFASIVAGVSLTTYRQAACPPDMLGRVSAAARWITWGTLPLGGVVGGALATALGVQATLWIAVAGGCCAGLWLFFSPLRGMRDIPLGKPEPAPVGGMP